MACGSGIFFLNFDCWDFYGGFFCLFLKGIVGAGGKVVKAATFDVAPGYNRKDLTLEF